MGAITLNCDDFDWRVYEGKRLRCIAMPLGGIGTGSISLCGDGSLRQWEILNIPNHTAYVPYSFFAIWVKGIGAKLLQSKPLADKFNPGVLANDHHVPSELLELTEKLPLVKETRFIGEYPLGIVLYNDADLPLDITLTAFSPFIPLNAKDSALPVIFFIFTIKNTSNQEHELSLLASLQNFVGWDGISKIKDTHFDLYGGNYNLLYQRDNFTAIIMRNSLIEKRSPRWGEIALALIGSGEHSWFLQWCRLEELWNVFSKNGTLPKDSFSEKSMPGSTWCGSLACKFKIKPGEERKVIFIYAWFFPNRYVNWNQFFSPIRDDKTLFWIGTMYAKWFKNVKDILNYVYKNLDNLIDQTLLFHDTFYDSTLPYSLLDRVSANISIIRSPTCFWAEDGNFYGFEGCQGASTQGNYGGCCPLNCTHVWNYEQTLSRLFPTLERTMREIEFFHQQHPSGYIPHRVVLPLYLPRPWRVPIGGPEKPALDGMLGAILKTYREYLWGADKRWLKDLWPRLKLLMKYVLENYMVDENGVIWGEQPNTYDISVYGANTFIGSLFLASLLAMAKIAEELGESNYAQEMLRIFKQASSTYDKLCWNGEYYIQVCREQDKNRDYQWFNGCLADQLIGQWWSHMLGLGYILPKEHVRRALKSIMKYNWRDHFREFPYKNRRIFVHEEHAGLLNCTWPKGNRPEKPILYCDEVFTGVEYEIASLLLYEGMYELAMKIIKAIRRRYDGTRMNPWNEIECGDHYVRAMSSWSLLEAALGYRYSAPSATLEFTPNLPLKEIKGFFITPSGWGTLYKKVNQKNEEYKILTKYGNVIIKNLILKTYDKPKEVYVMLQHRSIPYRIATIDNGLIKIQFEQEIVLKANEALEISISY